MVTVVITGLRYIAAQAELSERECTVAAVQTIPDAIRRPEDGNVRFTVTVKITRSRYISRLAKMDRGKARGRALIVPVALRSTIYRQVRFAVTVKVGP